MIRPMPGYVLIKQEEVKNTTSSGLVLPDSAQKEMFRGEVVATCDTYVVGNVERKCPVTVGEKVSYRGFSAFQVNQYLIVAIADLLAVLE